MPATLNQTSSSSTDCHVILHGGFCKRHFGGGTLKVPKIIISIYYCESTITAANKYSAFGCKSGYKSKGGEQGQNSPFTLIQFMTRICALNGWKLILAKTVPCAVESFTAYTCSSYYRRSIRTSLSSLQSHVSLVISLWSNSYIRHSEDGWNGARFQTTSTSLVRNNQLPIFFRACCYP